jgi:hypothetical protein
MIRVAVSAVVEGAAKELNAQASGDALQPELLTDGTELLNLILDDWNATRGMIYADVFQSFTLPTGTNPVTIGSGGNFNLSQPPVSIEGIQVVFPGGTPAYRYCQPRDRQWWQSRPAPTLQSGFPTDFYYDNTWNELSASPLGSIYFWPVATTPYEVQVWMRKILGQVTPTTMLGLPPGYAYAMRMELAKRWATPLRKAWTEVQERSRTAALELVGSNNNSDPMRIATRDAGMPNSAGGARPNFFWPTGRLVE